MSKGLTPIRLVVVVTILGILTAFTMNAAVEDRLQLLRVIEWLLADGPNGPLDQ